MDNLLQKQFDFLSSLLHDNDHRVRAAAASGTCHVLKEYWEALPTSEIKKILSYLVNTLSSDSSSAAVRQAVISGLSEILDQPLSHNILSKILPNLGNTLHDNTECVRLAFIELLVKVSISTSLISSNHILVFANFDLLNLGQRLT